MKTKMIALVLALGLFLGPLGWKWNTVASAADEPSVTLSAEVTAVGEDSATLERANGMTATATPPDGVTVGEEAVIVELGGGRTTIGWPTDDGIVWERAISLGWSWGG